MSRHGLSIGAVSKRTGCNIETIRYYERIGLLAEPGRTAGGHRVFGRDEVKRLLFIRRARELGFTLHDIRLLMGLADDHAHTCAEVEGIARRHLETVRGKLRDLKTLERLLADLVSRCRAEGRPECPILEAFFGEGERRTV